MALIEVGKEPASAVEADDPTTPAPIPHPVQDRQRLQHHKGQTNFNREEICLLAGMAGLLHLHITLLMTDRPMIAMDGEAHLVMLVLRETMHVMAEKITVAALERVGATTTISQKVIAARCRTRARPTLRAHPHGETSMTMTLANLSHSPISRQDAKRGAVVVSGVYALTEEGWQFKPRPGMI